VALGIGLAVKVGTLVNVGLTAGLIVALAVGPVTLVGEATEVTGRV